MVSTVRADQDAPGLTEEGRRMAEEVARRHDVSTDAVLTLLRALERGGGTQAQFSHPDLGGMGQWSQRGMIMVGDMFNTGLRARVDQLCNELADLAQRHALFGGSRGFQWWPDGLGTPSASGGQNDMRYACFPDTRRLAVQRDGALNLYDTGDHRILGVSQQQSGGQDLTFTSQHGLVRLHELARIDEAGGPHREGAPPEPQRERPAVAMRPDAPGSPARTREPPRADDDPFAKIERLHELQQRGVLTEAEFTEKKKDLLSRI